VRGIEFSSETSALLVALKHHSDLSTYLAELQSSDEFSKPVTTGYRFGYCDCRSSRLNLLAKLLYEPSANRPNNGKTPMFINVSKNEQNVSSLCLTAHMN